MPRNVARAHATAEGGQTLAQPDAARMTVAELQAELQRAGHEWRADEDGRPLRKPQLRARGSNKTTRQFWLKTNEQWKPKTKWTPNMVTYVNKRGKNETSEKELDAKPPSVMRGSPSKKMSKTSAPDPAKVPGGKRAGVAVVIPHWQEDQDDAAVT